MNWYKIAQNLDTDEYLSIKEYWNSKYPINNEQPGDAVPNTDSISASLYEWEELPGIRNVSMSDFGGPKSVFYAADDFRKSKKLAEEIRKSGYVSPLIIIIDRDGPYILEGAHRYVALYELGYKSFPALVILDKELSLEKNPSPGSAKNMLPNDTTDIKEINY